MVMEASAVFNYNGVDLHFYGRHSSDHVFEYLRDKHTFYEIDVLEFIRSRLDGRGGVAIDAGAFMGTHAIYFAKFCAVDRVYAYEANPDTFGVLVRNIDANGAIDTIIPVNKALGDTLGWCESVTLDSDNTGSNVVTANDKADTGSIALTTLDAEYDQYGTSNVRLIKIDVEGMEIDVLRGAAKLIAECRPLLCVEIHTVERMRNVLSMLHQQRYVPVECLGYSPTYLLESRKLSMLRYHPGILCWLLYGLIPSRYNRLKWYSKRLAQFITAA